MYTNDHSQLATWQVLAGAVGAFLLILGWFAFGILPTGAILLLTVTAFLGAVSIVLLGIGARRLASDVMYGNSHRFAAMAPAMPLPEFTAPPETSRTTGPAIELELMPEERSLLIEMLGDGLGNLRMEIGHTDSYRMRDDLKRREETMQRLLARLRMADPIDSLASDSAMVDMRWAIETDA